DVGIAPRLEGLAVVTAQRVRRDDDDRDVTERWVALDAAGGRVAVEPRELGVPQDQVGALPLRPGYPLLAPPRLHHLVLDAVQEVAQDPPVVLLILYHQNTLAHLHYSFASTRTGRVKRKVEPWPRLDSTQMRPPCRVMIRRAIASPRPVPPFLRVLELSA